MLLKQKEGRRTCGSEDSLIDVNQACLSFANLYRALLTLKSMYPFLSMSNVRKTWSQNSSAFPDGKNILYLCVDKGESLARNEAADKLLINLHVYELCGSQTTVGTIALLNQNARTRKQSRKNVILISNRCCVLCRSLIMWGRKSNYMESGGRTSGTHSTYQLNVNFKFRFHHELRTIGMEKKERKSELFRLMTCDGWKLKWDFGVWPHQFVVQTSLRLKKGLSGKTFCESSLNV